MRNRYAIGYIRGRLINKKRTPDWEMQRKVLKEYAAANAYVYLDTLGETQTAKKGMKLEMQALIRACELCKQKKADFLYVDLGNWRRSPVFFKFVTNNQKSRTGFDMIAIKDLGIIEEMQRLAKFDKHFRPDGTPIRHRTASEKKAIRFRVDPCLEWQEKNGISIRRYRNFCHLTSGSDPIYRVIESLSGRSDQQIATSLHRKRYVTVDGKQWQRENVRRTRKIIQEDIFKNFCVVREESTFALLK